jgi:hypothetical protein
MGKKLSGVYGIINSAYTPPVDVIDDFIGSGLSMDRV